MPDAAQNYLHAWPVERPEDRYRA